MSMTPTGKLRWNNSTLEQEFHHGGRYEWREVPDALPLREDAQPASVKAGAATAGFVADTIGGMPFRGNRFDGDVFDVHGQWLGKVVDDPAAGATLAAVTADRNSWRGTALALERERDDARAKRDTLGARVHDLNRENQALRIERDEARAERGTLGARVRQAYSLLNRNQAEAQEAIEAIMKERDELRAWLSGRAQGL